MNVPESKGTRPAPLSPQEKEALTLLYTDLGAWTQGEGVAALGQERFQELLRAGLLARQETLMGPVYHLMAPGRKAVFGTTDDAASFASQLDQCYLRLSLAELGWELLPEGDPFSRELQQYAPTRNFHEARTEYGVALVMGKLTGGGVSSDHLKYLAETQRSQALSKRYFLVILTPSKRKGEGIAARYESFIRLRTHLPRTTSDASLTRFFTVPTGKPKDASPILTSASAQKARRARNPLPELTLETLQLNRRSRIEQAEAALMCDGVLTSQQLERHFGLVPTDLSGHLATTTVVRPKGKSCRTEVTTHLLVAHRRMTRLSDEVLMHRVGLSGTRQQLSIPPDPERWIVEPGGRTSVELPDAKWVNENGEQWAVEFDPGNYTYSTVEDKLQSFRDQDYSSIIYSVTSAVRQRNIYQRFEKQLGQMPVLVQWW